MREFWLELSPGLSEAQARRLIRSAGTGAVLVHSTSDKLYQTKTAIGRAGETIEIASTIKQANAAKQSKSRVAVEFTIRNKEDHENAVKALELRPDYLLISCPDWKVIPLENLIAEARGRSKLMARTGSFEESKTALSTLEIGVDGIVLSSIDPVEITKTRQLLEEGTRTVNLLNAKVAHVNPLGTGSRVCVDTVELLSRGEGLLTGCSSQALFLVEGEVHSNPHVNPRPFRVNAGPVSLYVLTPGGKTKYLSELSAGEQVLLVNEKGMTRSVDVARVKIERRPMVMVEASLGKESVRTILQNAETVRLVTPNGSKPVTELQPGDEVLIRTEEGGRHFGTIVPEEMVVEK